MGLLLFFPINMGKLPCIRKSWLIWSSIRGLVISFLEAPYWRWKLCDVSQPWGWEIYPNGFWIVNQARELKQNLSLSAPAVAQSEECSRILFRLNSPWRVRFLLCFKVSFWITFWITTCWLSIRVFGTWSASFSGVNKRPRVLYLDATYVLLWVVLSLLLCFEEKLGCYRFDVATWRDLSNIF